MTSNHTFLPWWKCLLALCMFIFVGQVTVPAPAHEDDDGHVHEAVPADPRRTYAPSPVPDRIVLTWTGDPSRSQAVSWRTDTSAGEAWAEIALSDGGPKFQANVRQVEAQKTTTLRTDLSTANYHTAEFTDLSPSTQYVYRVGDGVNWSEWSEFTTASEKHAPFSFIYVGDAQNDVKSHWSRLIRQAFRDAPRASFSLHAGDLINRAHSDREWGEWFYAAGWMHRTMPVVAVPGNHEYDPHWENGNEGEELLSVQWRPTFAFPLNGPEGLEESVYYLDYQGTRIIALNTNVKQQEQAEWLRGIMAESDPQWTIVTMHHPLFSAAKGRDNRRLRALLQPVFDELGVDLVLQGHDHTYARSGLMTAENVPTGRRAQAGSGGTVYVVSVSGPKMYPLEDQPIMKRSAEDTQLYQIIKVLGDELKYEAYTATGELYDAFLLRKQPGQANELVEMVPDTKERRRSQE